MLVRFFIYGLLGWAAEIVWTCIHQIYKKEQPGWTLKGHTSLWMFPIYGLLAPLFEPVHNLIRPLHFLVRGIIYVFGFWFVEFISGWLLRRTLGACPWDYSSAKYNLGGLIRFDYAPLWFSFGLFIEYMHDKLVFITPSIIRSFS